MLDHSGQLPGGCPPAPVLSALRGEPDPASARAEADAALDRAFALIDVLKCARIRYAADTTDNAWCLRQAVREAEDALAAIGLRLLGRVLRP